MHREITAFLQPVQGIFATIGHSCNLLRQPQGILATFWGIFATCRAFLQHCIAVTRPGFEVGYSDNNNNKNKTNNNKNKNKNNDNSKSK